MKQPLALFLLVLFFASGQTSYTRTGTADSRVCTNCLRSRQCHVEGETCDACASPLAIKRSALAYGAVYSNSIQAVSFSGQDAETTHQYGFDPTSPLLSRVQKTSDAVLKMLTEEGDVAPTDHPLTEIEQRQLAIAIAALPPLHQHILRTRLRRISFLNGMPNTALTSTVNPDDPKPLFDLTIRAGVLHQSVSEWLTQKERTCFDATGSPLRVSIEAGKQAALLYVLLHEATHMVDASLQLTPPSLPPSSPAQNASSKAFTQGVWTNRNTPVPSYYDPLREQGRFRSGGKVLPIDQAEAVYQSLRRTPFVSLYGTASWHEDLAEYVAVYHWTQKFKQPYRIVLHKSEQTVFMYEPMRSNLVRRRMGQMKRFYAR